MRQADLDRLAREEIVELGVAPAAVVGVATHSGSAWRSLVGAAGRTPDGPVDPTTIFDLASVSKPFVAATFVTLVREGRLRAETRLGELLPECRETSLRETSLELLLSHRAGLVPHLPLFQPLVERRPFVRSEALRIALRAPATQSAENGSYPALYSDLGYLLTGIALERALDLSLDELARQRVASPLALDVASARQWLSRDVGFLARVAPTERVTFRGQVRGVVHDENAWAFAGHGLAGHAGLFGTIEAVLGFGTALLDALAGRKNSWLDAESVELMVRERPQGSLRLGFDGKTGPDSAAGPSASPRTFGHLGYTGTSLWCDPMTDTVTALLTNRVCPTRANLRIRAARPRVHETLFAFGHRA